LTSRTGTQRGAGRDVVVAPAAPFRFATVLDVGTVVDFGGGARGAVVVGFGAGRIGAFAPATVVLGVTPAPPDSFSPAA
jgi:hypothetical protein